MLPITYREYHDAVRECAKTARELAEQNGSDIDDELHELVDGHEFIGYTAKAFAVLWHSMNWLEGDENEALCQAGSFTDAVGIYAYHAMLADVQDALLAF